MSAYIRHYFVKTRHGIRRFQAKPPRLRLVAKRHIGQLVAGYATKRTRNAGIKVVQL